MKSNYILNYKFAIRINISNLSFVSYSFSLAYLRTLTISINESSYYYESFGYYPATSDIRITVYKSTIVSQTWSHYESSSFYILILKF